MHALHRNLGGSLSLTPGQHPLSGTGVSITLAPRGLQHPGLVVPAEPTGVLLDQVLDDLGLLPTIPACEGREEQVVRGPSSCEDVKSAAGSLLETELRGRARTAAECLDAARYGLDP